ncbi:MAG: sigma-54 dependent transcriptional regulator [Alphaproteobacteria bacterium]|nr:sigma-54 dependent transcriptional regulator [Alphaproteobacteria bacterium]
MAKVLVVDDDPVQLRLTSEVARKAGFDVVTAAGGAEALSILAGGSAVGAMVLDLVMPDLDGLGVLEAMQARDISIPVIVQTAKSSLDTVISAMRLGAADFFVKPVAPERLIISLRNALQIGELETALRTERARLHGEFRISDILTRSPAMDRTLELCRKAAKTNIPVLIEGESGTGKELIARAIQGSGDRAGKSFIAVNCGAIPGDLVESVLFGHVKGAFTGASADHAGKFQEAHGGTLFLDEIGELPQDAQVKLLRALQEGEVEPVGAARPVKVNVRLISATNRRLLNMARDGSFREDLYYRLNVFPIFVPPLRERPEDMALLAEHFLARFVAETGKRLAGLSGEALRLLCAYDWPGNVRQLENAIYRAVVLADGEQLRPVDFPQIGARRAGLDEMRAQVRRLPLPDGPIRIDETPPARRIERPEPKPQAFDRFLDPEGDLQPLSAIERDLILFAIERCDGRMTRVARALGIGRSTLYRKLKEYGIDSEEDVAA